VEAEGESPLDTLKQRRDETNEVYYKLRDMLLAQATVAGFPDLYTTTITAWNAIVDKFNQVIAIRRGIKNKQAKAA
jgi:hypothetical protein